MLSKKSYFKPALFWDDLRRFSPIWVCASLGILLLPFVTWMQYQQYLRNEVNGLVVAYGSEYAVGTSLTSLDSFAMDANEFLFDMICGAGPILILLYALVPAMALLHYLYQSRSALGVHALPITRSTLFTTHYVAGLAMMLIPLLIFCVVTIPVLLIVGAFWPLTILYFCAIAFGMYLFFFSFAIFCGMFTGQLWGVPLFYAIFNALASITFLFFIMLAQQFLFGFSTANIDEIVVQALTPVWQFSEALRLENITALGTFKLYGMHTVACYAAIGLCLAFVAFTLFNARHLERAGEIVSVHFMRPLFTTSLGVYGGFCSVMLYSYLFNALETGWMFFFLILGTLFGYAIGRMLLEKTLAIFTLHNAKHLVGVLLLSVVCLATVRFDLLGYAPYIPETDDIEKVNVSATFFADNLTLYSSNTGLCTATTKEDIALVRSAHAAFLQDYERTHERYPSPTAEVVTTEPAISHAETNTDGQAINLSEYTYGTRTTSIDFSYTLTNGQVITRSYYLLATQAELARKDSPMYYLETFVNGYPLAALLENFRTSTGVTISLIDADGFSNYQTAEPGTPLANNALDAVLVDIKTNGSTLSLMRKYYQMEQTGDIDFNFYKENESTHEKLYFYDGYASVDLYPGTNAEAFVIANMAPEKVS